MKSLIALIVASLALQLSSLAQQPETHEEWQSRMTQRFQQEHGIETGGAKYKGSQKWVYEKEKNKDRLIINHQNTSGIPAWLKVILVILSIIVAGKIISFIGKSLTR